MQRERRLRSNLSSPIPAVLLLLVLGALLWAPASAWSDDRDLLRESSGDPYLFIILDTSGSMNEKPETSSATLAAGDDTSSKLYQAKEALYEVMKEFDNISYGFATYNQDHLRALRKHWIYQPVTAPSWSATLNYPVQDQGYAFGGGAASNTQFACTAPLSLPAIDANLAALIGYPRGGDLGNQTHGIWLKQTRTYYVETRISSGTLGDATIQVQLTRRRLSAGAGRCNNNPPVNTFFDETVGPITITYRLVTDTLLQDQVNDKEADNTCTPGWDANTDTSKDFYEIKSVSPDVTVNIKYPTTTDSNPLFSTNPRFDSGDVLPLSWTADHKDEILSRLAPNLRLGETVPDFRVARYFKDRITGSGATFGLELKNTNVRPLIGEGLTPLGNTVEAFRTWYAGCAHGTCPKNTGWKDVAATHDPNWPCRKKFLIVLTDGDETCSNGNGACSGTASLKAQESVTTFVIAFGVQGGSNVLTCMAANGGSGAPVYPQNKAALLQALRDIFGAIKEQSRTFASAAVPGVQAEVQDKIYLTNFTPLNGNSYWDGHVDAYLKPLPLTTSGLPDKSRLCTGGLTSGCRVWDAGEKILNLAPNTAELAAASPDFHIGGGSNQRRVFYTQAQTGGTVPAARKLLLPPTNDTDRVDLWRGLGVTVPSLSDTAAVTAANNEVLTILKSTFKIKNDLVTDPAGGPDQPITYLLGDIFHSNPILLSTPNRARYFAVNLYTQGKTCSNDDPGYRCFASKHQRRRKMLAVGSNDQQIHIFDAGIFRGDTQTGLFDDGTGYEIFSYVPRPVLNNLKVLTNDTTQHWGVDGTIQFDDVYIDPIHTGTPTASERQWRSIVVGGLREGGHGYYSLDLTQPDAFDTSGVPQPTSTWVPSCWNGGTGCGPVPFGSVLWNFTDGTDEDANGAPDLGETWSTPNTGRIRVKTSDAPPTFEDRYVAVFGGGMDPASENKQGTWLYMVDIETGKAIYKRHLEGSAPSDPAAVDIDQDGYLDTVYIGTTAGYMYKADLRNAGVIEKIPPTMEWKITDPAWEPFKIFDTLQAGTLSTRGPIFFPPSVLFVTQLGKYALAFGTGNRENLWNNDGTPGRFYVILDNDFKLATTTTPKVETDFTNVTNFAQAPAGSDFLANPPTGTQPGWYLELDADERIITKPFALSGILIFTSYDPRTVVSSGSGGSSGPGNGGGNGGGGGNSGNPNATPVCARSGESNIFTVYTTTGDPVGNPTNGTDPSAPLLDLSRFRRVSDFVTSPFVESSATKNSPSSTSGGGSGGSGGTTAGVPLCRDKQAVAQRLMALFPSNCQFANHTLNIETIQSDNGLVCIAPVPVCVIRKNWKED